MRGYFNAMFIFIHERKTCADNVSRDTLRHLLEEGNWNMGFSEDAKRKMMLTADMVGAMSMLPREKLQDPKYIQVLLAGIAGLTEALCFLGEEMGSLRDELDELKREKVERN